ncbi:MAG TPA: TetR/AcrR family transcriptional regulator [Streptosporangiaceae bacterium]|jgi:AcrR family transcriptional regulator|nr:TetR/AcrR family transcriptional regulator [Streptosporangiaceae bacterium]
MTTEQAATGRTADRGSATRAVLLAAARQVFMLEGYAEAGVTDIVALAGASVGSLYHHFSGKADLYLALFEELHNEYDVRTRKAVRECRDRGVTDPLRLLLAGARGYLDVCIEQRDLARMFARGDGPPGFELLWRQRLSDWVSRNTEFFARSGEPLDEAAAIVMTGAMMLAVAEVSLAPDAARARQLADGVIEVLSRLRVTPASGPA